MKRQDLCKHTLQDTTNSKLFYCKKKEKYGTKEIGIICINCKHYENKYQLKLKFE